jgi:hypothetical protein
MDYLTFCDQNKDKVKFELMRIIDNKTLHEYRSILSNVMCDGLNYYIANEMVSLPFTRRDFRRRVNSLALIFGRKPKLVRTSNDAQYTRLIYAF